MIDLKLLTEQYEGFLSYLREPKTAQWYPNINLRHLAMVMAFRYCEGKVNEDN